MTDYKAFLKNYDGPEIRLMEVCGTHTAQISKCGIPSMLSKKIRLISGPGCPVCVTVTSYVDRLIALLDNPNNVVVTFGDMMRVSGTKQSLMDQKAAGKRVEMVYSPLDTLKLAKEYPARTFIFAAVGFETTTPAYALLLEEAMNSGIQNIRLLTSLKTMPPVIRWVCENGSGVDGFLAPGHVSVITGSACFEPLARQYGIPFAVSGFEGEEILSSIYALVKCQKMGRVMNLYPSVVTKEGNKTAQKLVQKYFEPSDAAWRGMGVISGSGMMLKQEYRAFDAGSEDLLQDHVKNPQCRCEQVLTGSLSPNDCPLFGTVCTPQSQQGACMVSTEGSCYNYYVNRREKQ